MSGLNKVTLIGRLGKDPEVKNLSTGSAVANFSVATSEKYKDKRSGEMVEKTEWHNIVVWNEKTIEFVEKYLNKGDTVYVEGKIQTRKWKDQDDKDRYSTEIVVPMFAGIEALQKLNYTDNGDGDRGSSRGRNDDDRGSDRGSSRSSGRAASRSSRDDGDSRGRDDDRGSSRASARSSRDDRAADDRGGSRRAAPARSNADMDDDIPF